MPPIRRALRLSEGSRRRLGGRDDPPTVGWSRGMGLTAFSVWCTACKHAARFTFEALGLPDDLVFVEIPRARRFVCTACGARSPAVMPDWRGYVASGTGSL